MEKSWGADKNCDAKNFVNGCRQINITPHMAQNTYEYDTLTGKRAQRENRIDDRTKWHAGYRVSQVNRKLIETFFGDGKQHGATICQIKLRGLPEVSGLFTLYAVDAGGQFTSLAGTRHGQSTLVGSGWTRAVRTVAARREITS